MTRTRPPVLASQPVLRPGQVPVPRGDGRLQVGGDQVPSAFLPDDPDVRRLLDDLADPTRPWRSPTTPQAIRALSDLLAGGLVVAAPRHEVERRLAGQHGTDWPGRIAARSQALVAVAGPSTVTGPVRSLLTEEGVDTVPVDPEHLQDVSPTQLILIAGETALRRDLLDPLTGPHLTVSAAPQGWQVGPLVVPGRTACLRCIDAARSTVDPRLPWVVDQWARRARPGAAPLSATLQQLALALAVREVVAWIDGDTPATWSATIQVPAVGMPVRTAWLRHPDCSCVWDLVLTDERGASDLDG